MECEVRRTCDRSESLPPKREPDKVGRNFQCLITYNDDSKGTAYITVIAETGAGWRAGNVDALAERKQG